MKDSHPDFGFRFRWLRHSLHGEYPTAQAGSPASDEERGLRD
jgi:hypothetical protein